jgi:GNAT superfamily N-acetyltransferase
VKFSVRAMTAQDIDEVLMLAARLVEAPHWSRRDYEQILLAAPSTSPPTALIRRAFIALSDSNLGGFAAAGWLPREAAAEVEGLVVDEKYRRQGMGSALIGEHAPGGAGIECGRACALSPPWLLRRRAPSRLLLCTSRRRCAAASAIGF